MSNATLEDCFTRFALSSRTGYSRGAQTYRLVHLAVKKGNIFVNILLQNTKAKDFESYSSFSYCTHSTVYRVICSSDRVVDYIKIDYI